MKAILLLALVFTLPGKCLARDPWVTLTGLTEAQLTSRVTTFSNDQLGVVPEQVSGYVENDQIRFAALWGPRTDAYTRRVVLDQTESQLAGINTTLQAAGWRLTWINGFAVNGVPHFNAIYRKTSGAPQVLRLGDTLSEHQSADSSLGDTHYLENLCVYRDGAAVRYAAVWNQAVFQLVTKASYGLTAEGLNADVAANQAGWRLHNVCGYTNPIVIGGESPLRFTTVWKKPVRSTGWGIIPAMTKENFFAADSNQTGVGWRTSFLQAWNQGDQVKFNAMWLPNGGLEQSYITQIDTLVRNAMQAEDLPGFTLAISRRGKLVFKRAYGLADTESNEWAGTNHRFRIASVSKPITGVSVVHALAGQSTWDLDSTVFGSGALFGTDYGAAPYSAFEQDITVRNLLHHTAGWTSEGKLWYFDEPSWGSEHEPFIDYQLQSESVTNEPGTVGRYSNLGYTIAARVVEKISGQSFESYTRSQVFAPCGISNLLGPLVGERTRAQKKFMEVSYYPNDNPTDPEVVDPRRMDGSTAWIARPADLLLLARRVDGDAAYEDILDAAGITALHTRGTPGSSSGYSWQTYGLGWACNDYSNPTRWGHNGSMAGTRAEWWYRTNGLAYAWAANAQGGISNTALENILNDITANSDWPDIDLFGTYHPAYNAWLAEHFEAVERSEGLDALLLSPDADPDGDDLPNAAEYYLGRDPREPDRSPFSVVVVGDQMRVRWSRKLGIDGVDARIQWSQDMGSWSVPPSFQIVDRSDLISQVGYRVQEMLVPMTTARRFARLDFSVR